MIPFDVLWLENTLIDVYVSLSRLKQKNTAAKEFLDNIDNGVMAQQTFFSYVSMTLREVMNALDEDIIRFDLLNMLHQRLASRGWTFYAQCIKDLIKETEQANSTAQSLGSIEQNVRQKLQDLHQNIKKTHNAIETQDSDVEATEYGGALYEVYIAIEEVKNSFTQYLQSKDISDLPDVDGLDMLTHYFQEMDMATVAGVSEQLTALFSKLRQKAPSRISWQLAHYIADSLSLFEMFLESLAHQVFDKALLTKAQENIALAQASIAEIADKNDEVLELFDIYDKLLKSHENKILYDDSGAIEPVAGEVVHSLNLDDDFKFAGGEVEDIEDIMTGEMIFDDMDEIQQAQVIESDNKKPVVSHADINLALKPPAIKPPVSEMTYSVDDVLLTDILSIPSISLSDGQNNDNDLKADAVRALNIVNETNDETSKNLDAYAIARASLKDDDFGYEEEFREIFVEEADEIMDELHVHLSVWQKNIHNLVPLKEIRRNFHTLKGSGRMVGAFGVGETAWAIENMLNRVLDHTIDVSPDLLTLITDTADIIPIMVQDFISGQPPSVDNALVVLQANNLLKGRPLTEGMPTGAVVDPLDSQEWVAEHHVHDVAPNFAESEINFRK